MCISASQKERIENVLLDIGEHEFPTAEFGKVFSERTGYDFEVLIYDKKSSIDNIPVMKSAFRINSKCYSFLFYLKNGKPTKIELYCNNEIIFFGILTTDSKYSEEVKDSFIFYRLHETKIFSDDLWETPFEVLEQVQEEQTPYFIEKWDKEEIKQEEIKQIDELRVKRLDKLNWTENSDLN
jgi:hypothetical protein